MIHKHTDGTCTASSRNCWIPGVYQDERTAKYAFRFTDAQLQALQDKKNKTTSVITFKDLQELKRKLKKNVIMENKKLIPLSDFVLEQERILKEVYANFTDPEELDEARLEFFVRVTNYTHFLKQPLKLEYFVPCDEEGNILRKPADDDYSFYTHKNQSVNEEYQEALEKVLFEGFEYTKNFRIAQTNVNGVSILFERLQFMNIERLSNTSNQIELTPSAVKLIEKIVYKINRYDSNQRR